MGTAGPNLWKRFWGYVGYGVGACVFLAIPLIAIDWLFKQIPYLGTLLDRLQQIGTPGLGVVLGLIAAVLFLAVLGWVLRRCLWNWVTRLPIVGTLVTSSQQFAHAVSHLDRDSRDKVVWVSLRYYRTLGVVVSRTKDEDGTEYATVFLLSGAGQFQGNQLISVRVSGLRFPGWTVDEAIVYSSSGGAVVPNAAKTG